ncbi:MAG: ATP-binding protein [Lachnospirales bacterium]
MLKKIHREVQEQLREIRFYNSEVLRNRKIKIYEELKEYKDLSISSKEEIIKYSRDILSKNSLLQKMSKEEREKQIAIREKQVKQDYAFALSREKEILVKNGYDEDFLALKYNCDVCKDSGIKESGKTCDCYNFMVSKKLVELSNLDKKIYMENFDNFDMSLYSKEKNPNSGYVPYDEMTNYVLDIKSRLNENVLPMNLYIYGDTGTGKTYLLNCILNEFLKKSKSFIYQTAPDFSNILNDYIFKNDNPLATNSYYNFLKNCDLLFIDDLGTEVFTTPILSEIYNIIDYRIRTNKSTIITSNLNLKNVDERYTPRVATRLVGHYKLINTINDKNIRFKKKYDLSS